MKLFKKIGFIALLAALGALLLCGCSEEPPEVPPHTHAWGNWLTEIAATCNAGGQEIRRCPCGEREERSLDATGAHLLDSDSTCVYCKEALTPSAGLEFEALTATTCQLLSVGTATGEVIVVPYYYDGMTVTQIGIEALKDQTAVKNIVLPNGLKTIDESAFYNCTSLESIAIPIATTSINASAFSCCYALSSIHFGTGSRLRTIGKTAFYCTDLRTVDFGDNSALRTIGDSAFFCCMKLSSVRFGKNSQLTTVGPYAFNSCSSLTSITLPEKVTQIRTYAFYDCKNLTEIILPVSLTRIDAYAFYLCDSLARVYYCGTVNDWDRITVSGDVGRYFDEATRYYYSETEPSGGKFNYWHYEPTPW